ncbi:magnesium/cobalt transporter CorA [Fulvivirga sp. RKSG066]|uniref:magnesium/cobalt transporter CorA n=1 Tax=Fulvivirga aurantia TaxID=2529383 RepID=UPI0012BCB03B|nr:magnesium/cobalt transporter CorA [Fulvivirga aurantia]MTI20342.1 magnesium/cobalt transporter CorA [Fulvivirga aurantia]
MPFQLPKIGIPSFVSKTKTAGLPPGQLVHLGEKLTDKSIVEFINYDKTNFHEASSEQPTEILTQIDPKKVNWINIDGLHNINLIKSVGDHFDIHPLVLEDILNPDQRPKVEDYENFLFFTVKTLNTLKPDDIVYEQMSFILGKDFLISFQEKEGDLFDGLRTRLRSDPNSKARVRDVDYLFYRLIDTIVDSYYLIIENLGERIEDLEDEVYLDPTNDTLKKIQALKKELIFLRKSVYPLREAISKISKDEYDFVNKETVRFFSDVYDHTIHIIETFETYRDLTTGLMDMYMTSISNKMNEVMKVLTIIATIFIPLTFIAGIYGMNFQYMPELTWKYGYFYALGAMGIIFIGMLFYFKKKKWL